MNLVVLPQDTGQGKVGRVVESTERRATANRNIGGSNPSPSTNIGMMPEDESNRDMNLWKLRNGTGNPSRAIGDTVRRVCNGHLTAHRSANNTKPDERQCAARRSRAGKPGAARHEGRVKAQG